MTKDVLNGVIYTNFSRIYICNLVLNFVYHYYGLKYLLNAAISNSVVINTK